MIHVMNYQFVVFFKQHIIRPDTFFNTLNEGIGNLFDRMPQIIPMPAEVPPEIPRVSATNSSDTYLMNVSLNRFDFTVNVADSKFREDEAMSDFIVKLKLIIKNLPNNYDVNRIGMVGNYFELEKNPATVLAKKLSRKDLGLVNEFNYRFNKISQDFGFNFNHILSFSSALINTKGVDAEGVFIQKDINNNPTDDIFKKELVIDVLMKKIKELTPDSLEGIY